MKCTNEIEIRFKSIDELNKFKNNKVISKMNFKEEESTLSFLEVDSEKKAFEILYELHNENILPLEFSVKEPTLENIFMEVIKS